MVTLMDKTTVIRQNGKLIVGAVRKNVLKLPHIRASNVLKLPEETARFYIFFLVLGEKFLLAIHLIWRYLNDAKELREFSYFIEVVKKISKIEIRKIVREIPLIHYMKATDLIGTV